MKKTVGLWIDQQEAVIVLISDAGQDIRHIKSHLEKPIRLSPEARFDPAEAARERRFTNHLNNYFDEVISYIHTVSAIMLFGPGETTIEFKNRLESQDLGGYIVGLETVGKLSDFQIASKVLQHFRA